MFLRLMKEPPFRLLGKLWGRYFPGSFKNKVYWESLDRPHFALGIWQAAAFARTLKIPEISVIEFGVAHGEGLLAMQSLAGKIEAESGIKIKVYGFDLGSGLPKTLDVRDHLDQWKTGDYLMDISYLQGRLTDRTKLILGDVAATIPAFKDHPPIGFISFDLDLYSSTMSAFAIFSSRNMLPHTPIYFDDIDLVFNHSYAGELLAIHDFNNLSQDVKIDHWRNIKQLSAFPESSWLDKMYMAHDLTVGQEKLNRVEAAKAYS
jgi:hypothetical protein